MALAFPDGYRAEAARQPALLLLDAEAFRQFYGAEGAPDSAYAATLRRTDDGLELRLESADAALPAPLDVIRDATNPNEGVLQGTLSDLQILPTGAGAEGALTFGTVRFVKLGDITEAALDFAETAVEIALGLIGILVLFLGLLKIAEDAGIVEAVVRLVRPVLGPLFPDIPRDHPAMGMIALNLAANVFRVRQTRPRRSGSRRWRSSRRSTPSPTRRPTPWSCSWP